MRYEYKRYAEPLLHLFKLHLHALAQLKVKRAERLVKQQHLRAVYKSPCYCNALLLPAGKLVYPPFAVALKVNKLEHFVYPRIYLVLRQLLYLQPERHVVVYVKMREKRVFLEHRIDPALIWRDGGYVLAVYKYPALRRHGKARDKPEHGRLAAAGRP